MEHSQIAQIIWSKVQDMNSSEHSYNKEDTSAKAETLEEAHPNSLEASPSLLAPRQRFLSTQQVSRDYDVTFL